MKCKFVFVLLFAIQLCSDARASKNGTGRVQSHNRRIARQGGGICECGVANDKRPKQSGNIEMIVAGEVVNPVYKYPWMVGIFWHGRETCGAALIAPRYLLTAGHCVAPAPDDAKRPEHKARCTPFLSNKYYCPVFLEDLELRYNGDFTGLGYATRVEEVIMSYDFEMDPTVDDIALIRSVEELPCNKFTAPICLPTVPGLYKPYKKVIVAGWGQTIGIDSPGPPPDQAVLKEANLILECREKCKQQTVMSPHSICCKESNGQACKGDSGGPLFKKFNGRYYLVGITSFGISKTCRMNSPTYYTKVKSYIPWIEKITGLAFN